MRSTIDSPRRRLIGALGAACAATVAPARAQDAWPSRPIRLVVPFAAGGIVDIMARVLGKPIGEALGQTLVVENRPGGGTTVATEAVARARPDGYTVLMVSAPIATNPGLYPKLSYDALKDFTPVIGLTEQGFVIAVHEKQPYRTLGELMDAARRADVPYASPGNGTLMHLVGQIANVEYGTRFAHVPYKGSGPAVQDAAAGQLPMIIDPISTSIGAIRQGRLRPLATTHSRRLELIPEVPTVEEAGFPRLRASAFSGVVVPAGTPRPIVDRLNAEFNRAIALPDVREKLVVQLGSPLTGGTAEAFGAMLARETERWVPLIRKLDLKAD
jgi:tripartite-type tricarboxylate transporter receptor subunit TctC